MSEIIAKKINKIFNCTIFELTEEEATRLIDKQVQGEKFCCEEKSLFIVRNLDGSAPGSITAIDNSTGDCFCEEFNTEQDAYIWLLGLATEDALHGAEAKEWWYF